MRKIRIFWMMKQATVTFAALTWCAMLSGCAAMASEIEIRDAWLREPPPVAETAAVYLVLRNAGKRDRVLVGAEAPVAARAMLHGMRMREGRMVMFPMDRLVVPADGEVRLAPGGMHLMLTGLARPLRAGERVTIRLRMADGETIPVRVRVRDAR